MDSKDRTFEFYSAIKSLKSRQINGFEGNKQEKKVEDATNLFGTMAKKIGKDLSSTYAKLEKLTLLARSKTLFDDRSKEIEELTYIIKQDIGSLNTHISELQKYLRQQKYDHKKGKKHVEKHSNSVVFTLQSKLASMSTEFKQVLELRTENIRQQKSRESQFIENNNSKFMHNLHHNQIEQNKYNNRNAMSPSLLGFQRKVLQSSLTGANATSAAANNNALGRVNQRKDVSISMDSYARSQDDGPSSSLATRPLLSTQKQSQVMLGDQTESYLASRAGAMQTIESTIVELGSIFSQLATMVKEQDEIIQRIDSNVEESHFSIEAAHGEILKYFQSLSSNRWLMIKIFGVLVVFFIIFVLFFS